MDAVAPPLVEFSAEDPVFMGLLLLLLLFFFFVYLLVRRSMVSFREGFERGRD